MCWVADMFRSCVLGRHELAGLAAASSRLDRLAMRGIAALPDKPLLHC